MTEYTYCLDSVLFVAPRKITTDSATANLIFNALCDFYGIDEDDINSVWDEIGFQKADAEFKINGKRRTITITRQK